MRTSYSAIETYQQCPQKYKFQEIDRIRVPKGREAVFGTLVHEALNFMFKKDPLFPTLDEVVSHFRESWPSLEDLNKESVHDPLKRAWSETEEKVYFEEGVRILKRFYEKNAPWNFSILDLESRFEVVLLDDITGETHILAGIMDRVDKLADGMYEIIDYKTSKRMPSQETLDQNLQLSLYALGLQKRWPHISPEEIKLSLYFVKHGEKLSTASNTEKTEKTKNQILETIREIKSHIDSGKEFEPMPSALCDWCGYKPLCPAWKHLYRKQEAVPDQAQTDATIKEFFELKKEQKKQDNRLDELQEEIKAYMERHGLTRVFGDEGYISKKNQQRFEYDIEKVKALLSPLGKWEEILKADETKLRKILMEIPEATRKEIERARKVKSEYTSLTTSFKSIKNPEEAAETEEVIAN